MKRFVVLMLLMAVLTACGSGGENEDASDASGTTSESPSETASETETPSPTPTPDPEPVSADVEIRCEGLGKDMQVYSGTVEDLEVFWQRGFDSCAFDTTATGTPSVQEQRALDAAGYRMKSLGLLWGICAENNPKSMEYLKTGGPSQFKELNAAFILCPSHPQRALVQSYLPAANRENALVQQGRVFYDGTYRVGQKVPSGTYYAKPTGDGCYWERTDAAGEIIDNNFSSGLRVEMTVLSSDFSIKTQGCGEWRAVGE